jgi:pimeloyl-ACP methyl ester carboxylesterase
VREQYDEFAMFGENIAEFGLEVDSHPVVSRESVALDDGRVISALRWGVGDPVAVLVHGGGQNAHTWDTVALALGVPVLAVDLPGHGHSSWRDDGTYDTESMADDIAVAIRSLAPTARVIVGMSLGGLTSLALADRHPNLVRSLVLVDITPGVTPTKVKAVTDFINGPQAFASFDDLLQRTIEHNPTRSVSSLRRGILHNARQLDDGSWEWRYDRRKARAASAGEMAEVPAAVRDWWAVIGGLVCPIMLVRGAASPVVDDEDVAELRRRRADAVVHVVEQAGHSVQGDQPVRLAAILRPLLG